MAKRSAGIVLVDLSGTEPRILLVHPGGPFWKNKDDGAWSIPKGEYGEDDDAEAAAVREFGEELGLALPDAPRLPLGDIRQAGGKVVTAWAVSGSIDPSAAQSNSFEMEWPPKSGRTQSFAEVDRAAFFTFAEAMVKMLAGQRPLLQRALDALQPP